MTAALAPLLAIAGLVPAAALLVRLPRPLFAAAADHGPSRRLEAALAGGLFMAGAMLYALGPEREIGGRWMLGLLGMTLLAIVYADLRFLVIPDLYSAVVAAAALVGPLARPLTEAAIGALVCGGLLAAVGYGFRRLRGIDGLGLGDVKLAAALGVLFGPVGGVRAIALAAICATLVVAALLGLRRAKPPASKAPGEACAEPMLAPFGAALALACGALELWSFR